MAIEIGELFGDSEVENIAEAVKDRLGDKYVIVEEENYIPKSKFETVRQEKKDIQEQLEERDGQLEDLKERAAGNEELEKRIEELQDQNKQLKEEYEQKVEKTKLDMAIENQLIKEKARNPKAVKALLNKEAISLDDDGEVIGLSEQLEKIKKEEDYLFGETGLKGKEAKKDGETTPVTEDNPFDPENINLQKQAEIMKDDPDKARKLIKSAGKDPANYNL